MDKQHAELLNSLYFAVSRLKSNIDALLIHDNNVTKERLLEYIGTFIGLYQRLNITGYFTPEEMKIVSNKILEVEQNG